MTKRKIPSFIWISSIGILIIIFTGVLLRHSMSIRKSNWETTTVVRKSLIHEVIVMGTLDAAQKVDVGAQVNGQLKKLTVGIGDAVKRNQLLGIIDPRQPLNQVKESEGSLLALHAQLEQAKIRCAFLKKTVGRESLLVRKNLISQQDFDEILSKMLIAAAEIKNIKAQIESNTAVLDTAKTNLEYTRIVAPINGIVTQITTHEGQTVIAAQQAPDILTLADMDTMLVNTRVSEADITNLHIGQDVWFTTLGDQNTKYSGHLKSILPTPIKINDAIFYQARFEVPNSSNRLRLGMTVQAHITLRAIKNILTIPISSLGTSIDGSSFHVMELKNKKTIARKVIIGIKNNVDAQVLSGLKEGAVVIIGENRSGI